MSGSDLQNAFHRTGPHRVSGSGQRPAPIVGSGVLAAVLALCLFASGPFASHSSARQDEPLVPESPLTEEPGILVDWIWAGSTTDASVVVKAALTDDTDATGIQLMVSPRDGVSEPSYVEPSNDDAGMFDDLLTFNVNGLSPDTGYSYAVMSGEVVDTTRMGEFRTFPTGAASFTFAFGACATTGSNAATFDTIREENPLFFLSTGDFYYEDIAENDPAVYREAFDDTLASPAQGALYQSTSLAYVWDDHDYGPNNSDSTSPGREAAQTTYSEVVPHYPLPEGEDEGAIYQAFTVGRVRFIMTDNYSYRSPDDARDDESKTMLGAGQKEWLKQELLAASDTHAAIVWVNSQPWIAEPGIDTDDWGAFATEREEIANFIAGNNIKGMVMLSGDAHMLAIDDGSHSGYATEGNGSASFPVFHAAALDRGGSEKGGPYSEGAFPGAGQFGLMTVNDDGGDTIGIIWSGRDHENEEIVGLTFTIDVNGGG